MLEFPAIFQTAGWVPVVCTLGVVWFISSSCAVLLVDAIARVPGNSRFGARLEFSDVAASFMGVAWFMPTQAAFFLCLLSQNVAAIVSTAQVIDSLLANFVFGHTFAVQVGD